MPRMASPSRSGATSNDMNRQSRPASAKACSTMKCVGLPATGWAIRQHFSISVGLVTGVAAATGWSVFGGIHSPSELAGTRRTDYSDACASAPQRQRGFMPIHPIWLWL